MNPQQRQLVLAVCFGMVIGPVLGPRLGDGAFWQVLPWLLLAAMWVLSLRRIKHTPPTA